MSSLQTPETPEEARQIIEQAAAQTTPLRLYGRGTKHGLGRPVEALIDLDLSKLDGIIFYEPEELVFSAHAGTSMHEIEAALAKFNQMLAFEPADLGPLYGHAPGSASIGGVFACNLSGPRRIKAGAARDHLLGFEAINGRGEAFKSGGRVMKNVSGYDLCKLITGSYGTLGALTALTFKVLPAPPTTTSVMITGLENTKAVEALCGAMGEAFEISGAAYLPAAAAARSEIGQIRQSGDGMAVMRLEGVAPSVAYRVEALQNFLKTCGEAQIVEHEASRALWREIADVRLIDSAGDHCIWKICVPPAEGANVTARLRDDLRFEYILDHSGGLIWLATMQSSVQSAQNIHASFADCGGHAQLVSAPANVHAGLPVFQPQTATLKTLTRRLKASFDPYAILNPGRMYEGV